jgi:hypothetical protein
LVASDGGILPPVLPTNLRLEAALTGRLGSLPVETISLTPRFNAVNHERTKKTV